MALTEEAKAELATAIAIVREDRFEKYVRTRETPPPKDPPKDPIIEDDPPKNPGGNPPPKKEDPPQNDPPKKTSKYWGEILDD